MSAEKLPTDVIQAYISQLMFLDSKTVLVFMFSGKHITQAERDIVSGVSNSRVDQMNKLLTLILKKFDSYQSSNDRSAYMDLFAAFLKVVAENCQKPRLAENMLRFHQTGLSEGSKSLAEARSDLGSFDLSALDFFVSNDETDAVKYSFVDNEHLSMFHYYPISVSETDDKLGYVLIVDIRDYAAFLGITRTDADSTLIRSTFENLNYKVSVESDLTATRFASMLETHLKLCEEGKFANFILFILAFGDESDLVCGVDGQTVSLIDIRRKVQEFPHLFGSPKLFFFLSARGTRPEPKVVTGTAALSARVRFLESSDSAHSDIDLPDSEGDSRKTSISRELKGSSVDRGDTVPRSADTLVCYACQRSFTVFGVKNKGSWFANIFCGVLVQRVKQMHLVDILAEVAFYMSSMKLCTGDDLSDVKYGQMPEVITTLRKRFYFVYPNM